jgi:hypothetical protein
MPSRIAAPPDSAELVPGTVARHGGRARTIAVASSGDIETTAVPAPATRALEPVAAGVAQ